MKNITILIPFFFLLHITQKIKTDLIPTSPESARANPYIIPYAHKKLTMLTAKIGAYAHRKNLTNRFQTFFETSITQNITKSLFISGGLLEPHKESQRENPFLSTSGALTIGNTYSYQKTKKLDFINTLISSGIALLPEKRKNRLALPVTAAIEWGLFNWINIGIREDLIFGFGKDLPIQNNLMTYLYADEPIRGLCIFIGFSNSYQTSSYRKYQWKLYTIHTAIGIDLATNYSPHLPNCSLFFDYALGSIAATNASHRVGLRIAALF